MTVESSGTAAAEVFWTAAATGAEVGTTGAEVGTTTLLDCERAGQLVTSGWERISIDLVEIDISDPTYTAGGDGLNLSGVDSLSDCGSSGNKASEESRGNNGETHFDVVWV